jgi:hypothetical protein
VKYKILCILFLSSLQLSAQSLCRTDVMNHEELIPVDKTKQFVKYNFSDLWLKTDNRLVYGIIGDEHQRILIKILTAVKNPHNPLEYIIKGKSSVKDNICDFNGRITVQEIKESKRTSYGVDNEFKGVSETQGVLIAKYELFENKNQKHSGVFSGILKTKWYLDRNNKVVYDDINIVSDGYFNNAFVGSWKIYGSKAGKKCNWADYRVPSSNCDFDIGAGELNVSKKYIKNGWLDVALKSKASNLSIIEGKTGKIKREWWM